MNTTSVMNDSLDGIRENKTALSTWQRIMATARMQFIDRNVFIYIPLLMLFGVLLIVVTIGILIRAATGDWGELDLSGMQYSWAILAPMWYLPAVAVSAINPTIHLAYAFSLSRREFYLGTILSFVAAAVFNATVLTLLWFIEKGTGGFWLDIFYVDSAVYSGQPWYNVFLISLFLYFSILVISAFATVLYLRWRVAGVLGFFAGIVVLLILAAVIVTALDVWEATGLWLIAQTTQTFFWLGAAAVAAGLLGFLVIRKATPKN